MSDRRAGALVLVDLHHGRGVHVEAGVTGHLRERLEPRRRGLQGLDHRTSPSLRVRLVDEAGGEDEQIEHGRVALTTPDDQASSIGQAKLGLLAPTQLVASLQIRGIDASAKLVEDPARFLGGDVDAKLKRDGVAGPQ